MNKTQFEKFLEQKEWIDNHLYMINESRNEYFRDLSKTYEPDWGITDWDYNLKTNTIDVNLDEYACSNRWWDNYSIPIEVFFMEQIEFWNNWWQDAWKIKVEKERLEKIERQKKDEIENKEFRRKQFEKLKKEFGND